MMSENAFRQQWQNKWGREPTDEEIATFQRIGLLPDDSLKGLRVLRTHLQLKPRVSVVDPFWPFVWA